MARPKRIMRVVALAASKGGVGKTTLSSALAVRAAAEGNKVALIDADPSASLEGWWELRGTPDNPKLLGVPCSAEGLGLVVAEGWDWVFIDTPPALVDEIEQAVSIADLVLIPTRASALDLQALDHIREIVRAQEKPHAYVLNAVEPGARITASAAAVLRREGTLLEPLIAYRRAYIAAMTAGRSGPEVERGGGCASEIDGLWASVKKMVAQGPRVK